ncbi:hypothetical protein FNV43_RR12600 [Rhamnella rubrinervis]|uniref:Alpha/beta hydrolase fold-3 domain-containing protein n=1 Tax=Rhamnella rubrinervis TaxID=2594499 RepID=A0A8K0H864_9ROSA|nr:hypothetical protein FNV43_RR12600 [Rhamnella rubrinervis]
MVQPSPALPWNVRLFVNSLAFLVDVCRRSNGTFNRTLINLLDSKASPLSKPVKGLQSSDVMVDKSRNLWFRLYTPLHHAAATDLPVIVYFHGGGFVLLAADSKTHDNFCQRLARELPAIIISVNYRLAPENRHPSAYDDGFDVLKFIDGADFKDRRPANSNLKRCFVGGDSAGGNLAHNVAVKAAEHEFDELRIVGVVALQPFFGGQERTESETRLARAPLVNVDRTDWMWKAFLPDGSDRDHAAVNVFGPNSVEISGLKFPATMVVVGGFDPLQDWQKKYYWGLKKQGKEAHLIEYPNAIHGFYIFPELQESSLLIKDMRDFISNAF